MQQYWRWERDEYDATFCDDCGEDVSEEALERGINLCAHCLRDADGG